MDLARGAEPHARSRRRRGTLRLLRRFELSVCLLVAAIALLAFAAPVEAQAPEASGTIQGRVTRSDAEDFGVEGVVVSVEGAEVSAVTDEDGRFRLVEVPDGDVVLLADAEDYESLRVDVSGEQRREPVDLAMVWAGEGFSSVTVVATQPRPETASTTRITPRDISAAPRRNAEEILRQVPGLTLVQHGSEGKGHQFFLRGFDAVHGADLELTVDGMPINEWSNVHAQGYLDLGFIIPELIQGVVVTKGPFTIDQGAFGMAGSADYRLGAPLSDVGWRVAYTAGTTNRHRVFAGYSPPDESGEQFVGVTATHDSGYGENREINRATFNGRVRLLDLAQRGRLYLTGLGSYAGFALPGTLRNEDVQAGRVGFYSAYDDFSRGSSGRGLAALTYEWEKDGHQVVVNGHGGYRRLELLENFTGFLLNPDEGDRRDQFQETGSFGATVNHESPLVRRLSLRTGLGLRGDVFDQREDNVGRQLEVFNQRRSLEGVQLIAHVRAGLRWTPVERVRVDLGGRLDLVHVGVTDRLADDARGEGVLFVPSPRASAQWEPVESWRLFVAYGRGYRPPEARAFSTFEVGQTGIGDELFSGGTPNATVSDAVEIGTRWDPARWFGVNLSGFGTFIERESIFDHVSGVNLEFNGTRRLGGELVLSSNPTPWLRVSSDLTMVDARFLGSGNRVPFAPWLTSGTRLVVTHKSGFRAGLRALVVAPRPLPHGATGATLLMTDATAGFHWRWLRLDLEVENVINQRLREGEYHYASNWQRGEPGSAIPVIHTTAGPPLNARLTLGVIF